MPGFGSETTGFTGCYCAILGVNDYFICSDFDEKFQTNGCIYSAGIYSRT